MTPETRDELRARIPGWGVDLGPADRPSVPREWPSDVHSAYGDEIIPQQDSDRPRERSIEHGRLTPVFGTSCPTRGVSGAVRRLAYRRWSEARAAHWLVLIAADRIDVVESSLRSWAHGRPDLPFVPTGLRAEVTHDGWGSRRGRVDVRHQALDPIVVVAPWALGGLGVAAAVRAVRSRRR
ncbi:MAG: hypothetical protein JWN84_3019 [Nocardioides sp.]|nr:hypothetical protein [Nocardioides sp.]